MDKSYRLSISETAMEMIHSIKNPKIIDNLKETLIKLTDSPLKQAKPLSGDLKRYFSKRFYFQRYRIIFHIDRNLKEIQIDGVGIRREGSKDDIYNLMKHLIK
jgi:mRNA interferase RelE/StbE